MHVVNAINVNDAYVQGLRHICEHGQLQDSRAGEVLVAPTPVTIVYAKPQERVLLDPSRDANPVFHLMEALFYLAGRNDAKWLDQFVSDFSARFAEEDGHLHGSYGFRWRRHFDMEGGGNPNLPDQLDTVVRMLKEDPDSRRAVISMWDPVADLGADKKDIPCNDVIFLRVRETSETISVTVPVLDITVCCRSNDFVWGMTGANAVQFSMLQEYLAGRIGVVVGRYVQMAHNCHLYTNALGKLDTPQQLETYPGFMPIGTNWDAWDDDLRKFMAWTGYEDPDVLTQEYTNTWFSETAEQLFLVNWMSKRGRKGMALAWLKSHEEIAPDWRKACIEWMERRLARSMSKSAETVV